MTVQLACLDMAGTTVSDDGVVEGAFAAALDRLAVDPADRGQMVGYVKDTMGTSKIEVFRALFGDEDRAGQANAAFESAFDDQVRSGAVRPLPGAADAIDRLRSAGVKVALTTGFSPRTRRLLLAAVGWTTVADLALSPADAGRGRPYPDMVLAAVLRLGVDSVQAVAVAGDTEVDMASGRRAGASVVAGVLTGADGRDRLLRGGATVVLDSVADLPDLLLG
ncbi:MAG TPA: phosphonatase-like hydrolase [Acidimicrobiales bacterium]|nr:phosphonatase-like hydrolase [Acidimicrobiales bacterium]